MVMTVKQVAEKIQVTKRTVYGEHTPLSQPLIFPTFLIMKFVTL